MARIGAILVPQWFPPEDLPEAARTAEGAGVEELWLWEDCFEHSAYAAASVALASTERLRVGIGISPMPMRSVVASAMEIATTARLFPGRLLPGVGHGVQSWMGQAGIRVASPLTLMREYVPALRALLEGETVTASGRYVSLEDVSLGWPPTVLPPLYASATGPKTLHLSGEVADGTVLQAGFTPDEIAEAVAAARAGFAGRDGAHDVVANIYAAFGPDAPARARAMIDAGIADIDERYLSGSPADVASGARRYFDAGVDAVILQPVRGDDWREYFRAMGEVTRMVGS